MKIMKLLDHKTLRYTNTVASSQERWIRANSIFGYNLLEINFAQHLCNLYHLWRPWYNPYMCLGLWEKKTQTYWCRTDSTCLPGAVGAQKVTTQDQRGVSVGGHRGNSVEIAWNLAGWREMAFWSRLMSWTSPEFKQIPSLRPRKQYFCYL